MKIRLICCGGTIVPMTMPNAANNQLLNSATSNLLYEFRVQGTLKDPKIKSVPAPILSDTAAFVFGRMVQGVRDGELMKTVRDATNTALHGKPVKKREEQQSRR